MNDRPEDIFRQYVKDKVLLLADSSPRVLSFTSALLTSMGVPGKNLYLAPNFKTAQDRIDKANPQIILCDYDLEDKCGLSLIQDQKIKINDPSKIFILVTGNTSQLAVAKGAEEDIDAYVLKPFTGGALRDAILKVISKRAIPCEYDQLIQKGITLTSMKKFDEAEQALNLARTLRPTPALAFYYLGLLEEQKGQPQKAQAHFLHGLKVNRVHYKSMQGLFELMMEQKKYADAYLILGRLTRYFPPQPDRLTNMFKLAILTRNYEDVERLYRGFLSLSEKTDELIKYVCAALVVCGKYYLQLNVKSRSIELFHQALKTAGTHAKILKEVVLALIDFGLYKEAEEFLRFFPASEKNTPEYFGLEYSLASRTALAPEIIVMGHQLLEKGIESSIIYQILIQQLIVSGQVDTAKTLIHTATTQFPELADSLNQILAKTPRKETTA